MSITVYSKPACVQCTATTRALDRQGIDYSVVDISQDADAFALVSDDLDAFVYAGYQYMGERFTEFSPQLSTYRKMDAYNVVNLRAGLTHEGVEFSVYANNALDSRGVIRALPASPFDPEARIRIVPRTVGANIRVAF